MCEQLQVSRSGFYAWRNRPVRTRRQEEEARLKRHIEEIHQASRQTYGWRRIWPMLKRRSLSIGRDRLQRYMRELGVSGRIRRRFRRTTNSNHSLPLAPNTLDRCFEQAEPDRVWVSDITYIRTAEGWLYLAVVLDLFSRRVVGHSIRDHMRTELVLDALEAATGLRGAPEGLLFHSDRGVQYASREQQRWLKARKIRCSMSRKADCLDNAVAESFFGTLKQEFVHRTHFQTHEQARRAIYEWIEVFYNRTRIHSALGYLSPVEFEDQHHQQAA